MPQHLTTLNEEAIRPSKLMEDKQKYVDADRDYLRSRRSEFVSVTCPACDAGDEVPAFKKLGFEYQRCSHCCTVYMNPRPSPEVLRDFYATSKNYEYWNRYIFPATDETRRERIFRPRAERLLSYCEKFSSPTGTLLEVGAGFGTFCQEVEKSGRFNRILAVEPTPDLAETCRSRGFEVYEKPIEETPTTLQADVMAAFEVVEHLFSPRAFVQQCLQRLSPGGLLVLTCPNVRGFDVATLETLSNTIDHEHLNYFHTQSLPLLLKDCGLEVLNVETPGKLDAELVRKEVLKGRVVLDHQPFLKHVLVDAWEDLGGPFQKFLAENGLSSHMWIVSQKPDV